MRHALKVLIVDDDKASLAMLTEVVKRLGLKPITANKPVDALNVVRLQTVHAAIVDVLLPKMTGVELVGEFRKTKFADNPVIFVSGVFKDKNFASDTIKKTSAAGFLFKPFAVDEMMEALRKAMSHLMFTEKFSVQSLLTQHLRSVRERVKAIEHIEPIGGRDFPFVLSILMDAGSSGNLNIVNEESEIFGIKLARGAITEVDSTESQSTAVLALIAKGFLSQEDWDEYQKSGQKKLSVEKLVEQGYVSPHAITDARREQIMYDLRSMCSAKVLHVNYMPQEEAEDPPKHSVNLFQLMSLLETDSHEIFPETFLKEFYEPVKKAPLRATADKDRMQVLLNSELVKKAPELHPAIEKGGTLEQALMSGKNNLQIYQALNFIFLNRAVIFDDVNRSKNQTLSLERYNKLYDSLKDKTADKIFEYFGAKENSSVAVIEKIFNEFKTSSHPDQLGKDATPELKELARKCYQLVSDAKDILTDESKKVKLFEQLKSQQAEKQGQAQKLTSEALDLIRKGQAKEALVKINEAQALAPAILQMVIAIWAEVKAGAHADKVKLHELAKKLENIHPDDRRSAFYYMASGVVKKALGDATAPAMFERALQMDHEFAEARRELNSMQAAVEKKEKDHKKLDLLTGDLSEIVSNIFKRKAE